MTERKLTTHQLNRLFCSPEFIRRVEATGKPSAVVFLEASDDEVSRWLAEGARLEKRIRSEVRHSSLSRDGAQGGFAGGALGMVRSGILGLLVAVGALGLCTFFTPFGHAMSPGTQWQFRGETYDWPAIVFLFAAIMGVPGFLGGAIVSRLARSPRSATAGFIGIAFGVFLHVWDMILDLDGGIIAAIVILLLPALCAVVLCSMANRVFAR